MPSSTRPATPGPSNVHQGSKRAMSDPESAPQDPKKARTNPSAEPSTRRDSTRDSKRRRRKKRKAPIVKTPAKDEVAQTRVDERSRAPLSARNEVIRFASLPLENDLPATVIPVTHSTPSLKQPHRSKVSADDPSEHRCETMKDQKWSATTEGPVAESSSSSLQDKIAKLEAELKSKNNLIASHHALLNQVQQAVTCQICLDLMYRPYALAPCGHLACHSCLVNWFTAPPPDNRPAPQAIMRRKTCPHCRAVVRERPVEVWGMKSVAQATGKSGLLPNQLPVPVEEPETLNANADPWKDIFPKPGAASPRGFPWFYPGAYIDDDDIHIADGAPRGEDVGMLDMEDGGIYRCLDCMHEIWDGMCSSCGRVYSGHRPEEDDEEFENPMGWLEDQMGAEEVDMVDDPGWMGLEDGEADDDSADEWRPWQHQFHMFSGPWGFLGTIHVDEEDEDEDEDETYGRVDDLRVLDEDEESGNEGYESSFIDDDDERGETTDIHGPRFYEIGDDDEDYHYHEQARAVVDPDSDDQEEEKHDGFDVPTHGWTGRRRTQVLFSSDEEADEREDGLGSSKHSLQVRQGRSYESVESDAGSDVVG